GGLRMCGIMGYVGHRSALPILLDGLRRLEYRGYDSAGVAVLNDGHIEVRKTAGKLAQLTEITSGPGLLHGTVGIGHTRWATHGRSAGSGRSAETRKRDEVDPYESRITNHKSPWKKLSAVRSNKRGEPTRSSCFAVTNRIASWRCGRSAR